MPSAFKSRRRTALLVTAALLVGGLLWAGWYVYNRGFTRKWRDQLTAELRRRGFDMTYSKLTLNPFEGLVIEEAHFYVLDPHAPGGHGAHLLYINRAAVDLSLANLIQKKPFLNSLDLRGARLSLPVNLDDPRGPKVRLRRFQAKLAILPGELRLTQAQGDFYGVQVSLSGTLLHPESFSPDGPPASPADQERRRQFARAVIDEIQKVRSDRLAAPAGHPLPGRPGAAGRVPRRRAAPGRGRAAGQLPAQRVSLRVDYAAGAFHLQQAELADAHGTLSAQGDYNPGTGEARFQLQSSLDLATLAREFTDFSALHDFTFRDAPRLRLDGRARLGAPVAASQAAAPAQLRPASNDAATPATGAFQLTGHLTLGRFGYQKYAFEQARRISPGAATAGICAGCGSCGRARAGSRSSAPTCYPSRAARGCG